jgi:hypothetical protein
MHITRFLPVTPFHSRIPEGFVFHRASLMQLLVFRPGPNFGTITHQIVHCSQFHIMLYSPSCLPLVTYCLLFFIPVTACFTIFFLNFIPRHIYDFPVLLYAVLLYAVLRKQSNPYFELRSAKVI